MGRPVRYLPAQRLVPSRGANPGLARRARRSPLASIGPLGCLAALFLPLLRVLPLLGVLPLPGGPWLIEAHASEQGGERPDPHRLIEQLGRVLVTVENEYVEPVDRAVLLEGALQGMVAALDPHSA